MTNKSLPKTCDNSYGITNTEPFSDSPNSLLSNKQSVICQNNQSINTEEK